MTGSGEKAPGGRPYPLSLSLLSAKGGASGRLEGTVHGGQLQGRPGAWTWLRWTWSSSVPAGLFFFQARRGRGGAGESERERAASASQQHKVSRKSRRLRAVSYLDPGAQRALPARSALELAGIAEDDLWDKYIVSSR